jgi:hypothetical protein
VTVTTSNEESELANAESADSESDDALTLGASAGISAPTNAPYSALTVPKAHTTLPRVLQLFLGPIQAPSYDLS